MNGKRRSTWILGLLLLVVAILSGCGSDQEDKAEDKAILQEVERRGFKDPAIAPDTMFDGVGHVYAGYGSCRLRLTVDGGRIGYGDQGDVSASSLTKVQGLQHCRTAASPSAPPSPSS